MFLPKKHHVSFDTLSAKYSDSNNRDFGKIPKRIRKWSEAFNNS